jgi:hypothetical protein
MAGYREKHHQPRKKVLWEGCRRWFGNDEDDVVDAGDLQSGSWSVTGVAYRKPSEMAGPRIQDDDRLHYICLFFGKYTYMVLYI